MTSLPGVSSFDVNGNHLHVSGTVGGYDAKAIVGKPVWESAIEPTVIQAAFMRCISAHIPVTFETTTMCPLGVVHHFVSTFHRLPRRTHVVAVWHTPYQGEQLLQREVDCLAALADGCQQDEVAERVGLSLSAVKEALHACRVKLAARTSTEAVAKAVRSGLI